MKGPTDFTEIPCVDPESSDVQYHPYQPEVDHLVDCILDDREPLVNIQDAVKTHEICIAADVSGAEKRSIRLPLK
jgi:predicted dehydrogenase